MSLPEASQEGKNTFGFKLDGEIWIPYAKCKNFGNPCSQELYDGVVLPNRTSPLLTLSARRENGSKTSFLVITSLVPITTKGNYIDSVNVSFTDEAGVNYSLPYPRSLSQNNLIVTKIDSIGNIVSGTFQFTLVRNFGEPGTPKITEGRFDVRYPYCNCSK